MPMTRRRRVLASIGAACALVLPPLTMSGPVQAQAVFESLDWTTYEIARFGVRLRYPGRLFRVERALPEGDGQLFVSRDGEAQLLVGVLKNPERLSPRSYQRRLAEQSYAGADMDYSPVGETWFVVSGNLDDKIFYEKAIFSCNGDELSSFAMVYPAAKRRLYDLVVEHVENSFRSTFARSGCR